MLARVARLEQARGVADDDGYFDAFAAGCEAGVVAGRLDRHDIAFILFCLRRWRSEYGVTFGAQRRRTR